MRGLVIVLVAGILLPFCVQGQLGRARYRPSCNAGLQASADFTSSQVSANCREQDLGTAVIRECLNSFIADVDAVGQYGNDLAATMEQLQQLKGQQQVDRGLEFLKKQTNLMQKAVALMDSIRKGGTVIQKYAVTCLKDATLSSITTPDVASTLLSAKKAVDSVGAVNNALIAKMERGEFTLSSGEKGTLAFIKAAWGAGQLVNTVQAKIVKTVDNLQPYEGRSRAAVAQAQAAVGQCQMQQADTQLNVAGQPAALALTQARYARAKAVSIRSCWAGHAWNYFQGLGGGGGGAFLRGTSGGQPLWQTMNLSGQSGNPALDGCTSCRDWAEAQRSAVAAEADEKRLGEYLASVNALCAQTTERARAYNTLEDQYLRWNDWGDMALRQGSCNLADAQKAADALRTLERQMATSSCAPGYEAGYASNLTLQIQSRGRDADCRTASVPQAAVQPAEGTGWPFGKQLVALCHVEYLPYTRRDGKTYPPHKGTDTHVGARVTWDAARRLYFVRWGASTIVGSGPSFSFTSNCKMDTSTNPVPGCMATSRDTYHMITGQFSMSSSTVTLTGQWLDDASGYYGTTRGISTCNYQK